MRVTIRSAAPHFKLTERFWPEISTWETEVDIGWIQRNAIEIRLEESAIAYKRFHTDWRKRVSDEAGDLRSLGPDLVLANVPYLPLAGAAEAGIPCAAFCSINWAEIYRHFFAGRRDEALSVETEMLDAYNAAQCFVQPEPAMPMSGINNLLPVGPVAQLGVNRRAELDQRLRVNPRDRLVLISLGGMDVPIPIERWPQYCNLKFVVPDSWASREPDVIRLDALGVPFADAIASCDALIAKPGYGSFVEAACLGLPVLYMERPNWPETPYLISWLRDKGRCAPVDLQTLISGDIKQSLEILLRAPVRPTVTPTGIAEAADVLTSLLR